MEIVSERQFTYGWAHAGNPIVWCQTFIGKELSMIEMTGDWSFGILHEISHNFDTILNGPWNFHAELMANFKMLYVLEKCNGTVYMDGKICKAPEGEEIYAIEDWVGSLFVHCLKKILLIQQFPVKSCLSLFLMIFNI